MSNENKYNNNIFKNQTGMAAILITMIMSIVISIVVLGYTQISSRVIQDSLNRQLGTEAFYAAESGVNDALFAVNNGDGAGKTSCNDWPSSYTKPALGVKITPPSNKLDGSVIEYTCLLVTTNPTGPVFAANTDSSTVANIQATSDIDTISLSWVAQPAPQYPLLFSTCPNASNYQNYYFTPHPTSSSPPDVSVPCAYAGVVRVDILPWDNAGESSAELQKSVMTLFLAPTDAETGSDDPNSSLPDPTQIQYSTNPNNQGKVYPVTCNGYEKPNKSFDGCAVSIEGINLPITDQATKQLYIRLLGVYTKSDVQVEAYAPGTYDEGDYNLNAMPIINSQAIIDSTGRANNVEQRILVDVPLQSFSGPSYAIQSTDSICKRYTVVPNPPAGDNQFDFQLPSNAPLNTVTDSCFPNTP